jgi:hypothetical protein
MFNALRNGRQGAETMHDVYCSECGLLTPVRSRNNVEGGAEAPTIELAKVCIITEIEDDGVCSYLISKPLDRSKYDLMPEQIVFKSAFAGQQADSKVMSMLFLPLPSLTRSAYHVFCRL